MAELTLHFETSPGTDMAAASAELQKNLAQVAGVDSAAAKPQHFQSVGLPEIVAVIDMTKTVVASSAALLGSLVTLLEVWKKVRKLFPGLRTPTVEVGLKKIPIDQVTAEHFEEITRDQ
jgi:hypothetical protein